MSLPAEAMSFRGHMVELFESHGLGLEQTSELHGDALEAANVNNAGIRQLWDEVVELHLNSIKNKKRKRFTTPLLASCISAIDGGGGRQKRVKRKYRMRLDDNGQPIKRNASGYAKFTALVTAANKSLPEGWDNVRIEVHELKGLSEDITARAAHLQGTTQSMASLLEAGQKIIHDIYGKVHPMKLAALLWSAIDKKTPFPSESSTDEEEPDFEATAKKAKPTSTVTAAQQEEPAVICWGSIRRDNGCTDDSDGDEVKQPY